MYSHLISNSFCFSHNKPHNYSGLSPVSAVPSTTPGGIGRLRTAPVKCFEESRERIIELIHKPEISISPYDTAWVAMVPSPNTKEPCFPDTLNWLLQNQCPDGSWSQPHHHSLLQKDVISSTLACILALRKWNLAHQQVDKGIRFIESNFTSITGKDQIVPMGFDIIFTGLLEYAKDLSLDLHLEPKILDDLICNRNLELKRWHKGQSMEIEAYMAYLSEGIGNLQEWGSIMEYQRKNGSLFNSPSTTAAACIFHHTDDGCLDYLYSALNMFGNAVPTIYPFKLYAQLCVVDNCERLGISQHFRKDIESVLDETYRCWQQGEEEIFMDASTCALAFRLLRLNGYDIVSDQINEVLEEGYLSSFVGGHTRDIHRTLDSYRASEIVFPNEAALEKHNLRLRRILEQGLLATSCYSNALGRNISKEVRNALQQPFYAITERSVNRRNIEHYTSDSTRILKTSFCSPSFGNKDFLFLSVTDFNKSQKVHQEELKELERWVVENRLDGLKFARQKSAYCYVSAATTLSSPEQSDARISYAKSAILATVVDDFFDVGGSFKELNNLIELVEAWDINLSTECYSENVLILFSALKCTICEIGSKASIQQGRNVTKHIIDSWLELLYSMLRETEWAKDGYMPSMDEYMNTAYISFALGPVVLPALYLVGPKLSEEMVCHPDYTNLFNLMSTCGRLLNDTQSYERELQQSKNNAVPLYMMSVGGDITEEVAVAAVKKMTDCYRRELHRLVLNGKNNVLPRACKDVFWRTNVVLQHIYSKGDGYSTDGLGEFVSSILYEPVVLGES